MREIATLEGLDGPRTCLLVSAGKSIVANGETLKPCRCIKHGTIGSGPADFRTMCKDKGLDIVIGMKVKDGKGTGGTVIRNSSKGALSMSRSLRSLPPPLELPPDEDMEDLGFLDALIEPGMPQAAGLAAAGGAAFGFLYRMGLNFRMKDDTGAEVQVLNETWKKIAAALGGGLVLGRLAWYLDSDAAKGVIGAAGAAVGEFVYKKLFTDLPTKENPSPRQLESGSAVDVDLSGFAGELSGGEVRVMDRRLIGDVGSTAVDERRAGQFSADLSSWIA
jgi:hypothetical protein